MIVGAESGNPTHTTELRRLAPPFGRLPVDLAIVPPVDRRTIRETLSQRISTRYSRISFTMHSESRLRFNCLSKHSSPTLT